jgi:hypothetical protein
MGFGFGEGAFSFILVLFILLVNFLLIRLLIGLSMKKASLNLGWLSFLT